jgi:hypothetical protein
MKHLARRSGLFAIAIRNKRYQIRRRMPLPQNYYIEYFEMYLNAYLDEYFI